jgi:tRNA G18 (ribose-2'-O)-methylase SpoU
MRKLSYREITEQRLSKEKLEETERFPIYTILDNIRSLHNVGSIFRTADAVRLEKLYLTGITGFPPRKDIDKTALGAVETVPWEYNKDVFALINTLKKQNIKIVVLEHTSDSQPYQEFTPEFPVCLVVGNEVFGTQDKIVEAADTALEIPMFGSKQSLNVTIAYGIVIYDLLFKYLQTLSR